MVKREGYHHAALRAQDLDVTIKFYEALGCSVVRTWGEGDGRAAMLDMGGANILEVFAGGKSVEQQNPKFEHIALKSSDVDGDFENALKAGATEQSAPADVSIGTYDVRIAFVVGPNGEVIEFFHEK